jgi:hypothetical protein
MAVVSGNDTVSILPRNGKAQKSFSRVMPNHDLHDLSRRLTGDHHADTNLAKFNAIGDIQHAVENAV